MATDATNEVTGNQFGTMGGVFTPSILTILGVVMFMSAGFVIGQAGIWSAVLILLVAKSITFLTSLSIAAISTNTPVKGGGAYFLISRSLGPEPGGAIGLTLFLAQALSVPFYILGFVGALVVAVPALKAYFLYLTIGTATALLVVNLFGAGWAIKVQYIILGILVIAIIVFMGGAIQNFSVAQFKANWNSGYTLPKYNFWTIFAIYFPAVTGIMTGVNMSGDLKDPARSIPRGTFYAIAVGLLVYFVEILLCGGSQPRTGLLDNFYKNLLSQSLFGLSLFVVAGVFAATLSSALGSLMGAPRILQALARDDIFPPLRPFSQGSGNGDEPVRGLWLTFALTLLVLLYAGNNSGGGALNAVGAILTMFFLYAYGITNIAAFAESFTRNPSFRPRFRFYHWLTALLGALGCGFAALLINWQAALLATAVIVVLFLYVRQRILTTTFGDVRRGFYYSRVRENLYKLGNQPPHPKNWRPNTLVLSGNPSSRMTLTQYAIWLENNRGLVTLAEIIEGDFERMQEERAEAKARLKDFIQENKLNAFHEVLLAEDFDQGLSSMLQCHSVGPIKPNLVMFGWPKSEERVDSFIEHLRVCRSLKRSMVLTVDRGFPTNIKSKKRVDIWWRGMKNGSLMLILTYLLQHNPEWANAEIRILRLIRNEDRKDKAYEEMLDLMESARIYGEAEVVVSTDSFTDVLHKYSVDATVVFLGFEVPGKDKEQRFHRQYNKMIEGLPTTLLISSSGEADLTA
jgi:amino acid transporter